MRRGTKTKRLTILRAATHETELGDHDFFLSQRGRERGREGAKERERERGRRRKREGERGGERERKGEIGGRQIKVRSILDWC